MKDVKRKMKICFIAGARPNFMKVAALIHACQSYHKDEIEYVLVHTGQHYDPEMSKIFFDELEINKPNHYLGVNAKEADTQEKEIVKKLLPILKQEFPGVVVVVGDVTSTIAGARAAHELGIPVAHVEAGLRSRNQLMREEYNRIEVDKIAEFLFATEEDAIQNLLAEGLENKNILLAGNVMIDTLHHYAQKMSGGKSRLLKKIGLHNQQYALATLHRAEIMNSMDLPRAFEILKIVGKKLRVVFPIHPRTRAKVIEIMGQDYFDKLKDGNVYILDPLGYFDFVILMRSAVVVLTDSGGIQEETSALAIPCLTMRNETERPITVTKGTNEVVGLDEQKIKECINKILSKDGWSKKGRGTDIWDGRAGERIINFLHKDFLRKQNLLTTHATSIHYSKN